MEFDHSTIEARVRELWETHDVYRFDRASSGPVFSVDTPPPYTSASHLHVGHAMSYTQADFVVRYRRMRGDHVFYPMGFDDNGLPTERYVEQTYGVRAADLPRAEFVGRCLAETARVAQRYEQVWRQLGLSVDWSLRYSTIDARSRCIAQQAFLRLYRAGHIRRAEDPILWCPECGTALAQADVDDLERQGRLHRLRFTATGDGGPREIATTRPELLPACVALYAHPDDQRYQDLAGGTAVVPGFGYEVPVHTDPAVDPGFGTGLMMVCTFGDAQDVLRWRRDRLALRLAVTADGRLGELAGEFAGLPLEQARPAILATLDAAGALAGSEPVRQVVGVHERCRTPVEFQIRPQWFIGITGHQEALRRRAAQLRWVPQAMRRRLEDWIDGLRWDWNLSRQRHYGVPFPVWFCRACAQPVLAEPASLPIDPLADPPPDGCKSCGSGDLDPDPDVMDTWMTSSLTPQINAAWDGEPDPRLAPMSLRVQAFEIIRTWLFYTLVQSHLHADRLPWHTVMISGWGLNEQGRKIAKRELAAGGEYNRYRPDDVMERYGADALRLWATKARIGTDLRYHEKDVRTGRRFLVKLWNLSRFLVQHLERRLESRPPSVAQRTPVDRWLLSHLATTVDEATAAMERYDATAAYQAASWCFWSICCDRYVEMVKGRFAYPAEHTEADRASARATLWEALRVQLGLFAPFAPFLTEHLYQELYRAHEEQVSLHLTAWPVPEPGWRTDTADIDALATVLDRVRALRTQLRLGTGRRLSTVVLHPVTAEAARLATAVAEPLRTAARAEAVVTGEAAHESGVPGLRVDVAA